MAQDRRVFLERRSYQRRRVVDAARMLPIFGLVLWLVPLLWPADMSTAQDVSQGGISIAAASLYVFGVWALLICLGIVLARTVPDHDQSLSGTHGGSAPETRETNAAHEADAGKASNPPDAEHAP